MVDVINDDMTPIQLSDALSDLRTEISNISNIADGLRETVVISYEVTNHSYLHNTSLVDSIKTLGESITDAIESLKTETVAQTKQSIGDVVDSLVGERPLVDSIKTLGESITDAIESLKTETVAQTKQSISDIVVSLVGDRPIGNDWKPKNGSLAEITNDMLIQQEFYSECFNVLNLDSGNKTFNQCAASFVDVDPNNVGLSDFNISVKHRNRDWGI
jgi:2',3'-cyclic-nucleotide 2'-phosphodiesterase (5'-nucleotidase family)